jgi:hypothetical protein
MAIPAIDVGDDVGRIRFLEESHFLQHCLQSGSTRSVAPTCAQEAQPVAVQDVGDVGVAVAALCQQAGEALQVGDGIQILGALFAAEAAVQVGADGGVAAVAGKLADVVDVLHNVGDR